MHDTNEPVAVRRLTWRMGVLLGLGACGLALPAAQCVSIGNPPPNYGVYYNTTDPTNNGATYVGSAACRACHNDFAAAHAIHGHAHALKTPQGAPPSYPTEAPLAGVPNPPAGFAWTDIAYVVGGHMHGAKFLDQSGYVIINSTSGVDSQWNLKSPPNGGGARFAPFGPADPVPLPFTFNEFAPRTTGARPQDPAAPRFQDGLAGIRGTWSEPGVQCEACHGPGSNHVPDPFARELFVDLTGAESCFKCHSQPYGATDGAIPVKESFIVPLAQYPELRASGGHRDFSCTYCHDTHASSVFDPDRGIRNRCTACHDTFDLGFHTGEVFTRGDYSEPLSCESCHMPFAVRSYSAADPSVVGPVARVADTRSHIFRINTQPLDYIAFLSPDGTQVRRDAEGRAALTVDYVCLRCHNGNGAFALTLPRAAEIASQIHKEFE